MKWFVKTNFVHYQMHDFGYRGVSSVETAAIGGCAHLVNFQSTDTLAGICLAQKYYSCPMAGFTIPASEHSTMTTWAPEHEVDAMRNMLDKFPAGPISAVCDSYDVYNAVDKIWGEELKEAVIKRQARKASVLDSQFSKERSSS
jgi:nicotinamide phosphoribosyltransferase